MHHPVGVILALCGEIIHGVFHHLRNLGHNTPVIIGETGGCHGWVLEQAGGAVINHAGNGYHAAGAQVGAVCQGIGIDIAHGHAIDVEVANLQLADDLRAALTQIHHNAVLRQDRPVAGHAGGNRQFLIGAQVAPLAVDRHGIARARRVVQEEQLAGVAVARCVDLDVLVGDDVGTNLGQHIDNAEDGLFVARDERGREDDGIAIAHRNLAVLAAGHAGQRSHWLTLRTGGNEHGLMRGHLRGLIDGDDGAARDLQKAHLFRDLHIAHHRTAIEGHLAAIGHGSIDGSLHAVDVRGEGSQDDALLRISHQAFEVGWDIALGGGYARHGGVGGIAQHEVDALVAVTRQRRKVGRAIIQRGLVQLDITGVDDIAGRGTQHDAERIRHGVVNRPEANAEAAVGHIGLFVDLNELRLLAVFLTLGRNERDSETGGHDGDIRAQLQQPRDGTDVVFVGVGDHEGLDLVDLFFNRPEVRQDEVHARLARRWEEHAAVNDEQLIAVLKDGHVAADFGDTAQGVDAQGILRLLWRFRQALGQISTLHGLRHVAAAAVIVIAATALAIAVLSVATVVVLVIAAVVIATLAIATVVIATLAIAIIAVSATTTAAAATGTRAAAVVIAVVLVIGRVILARVALLLISGSAGVIGRGLKYGRSRLIGGGLSFRRWTRLAGDLAGTVTGFSHS